jgi:hypothetical protein
LPCWPRASSRSTRPDLLDDRHVHRGCSSCLRWIAWGPILQMVQDREIGESSSPSRRPMQRAPGGGEDPGEQCRPSPRRDARPRSWSRRTRPRGERWVREELLAKSRMDAEELLARRPQAARGREAQGHRRGPRARRGPGAASGAAAGGVLRLRRGEASASLVNRVHLQDREPARRRRARSPPTPPPPPEAEASGYLAKPFGGRSSRKDFGAVAHASAMVPRGAGASAPRRRPGAGRRSSRGP